jgi:tetratricopeptide (TPR) repeat protein
MSQLLCVLALRALALRAVRESSRGQRLAALRVVERMLARDPACGWALFHRAGLRLAGNDRTGTLADLRRVAALPPAALFGGGREPEVPLPSAFPLLRPRALALARARPREAWVRVFEAFVRRETDDHERAAAAMRAACAAAPRDPAVLALLARVLFVGRLPGEGVRALQKAHTLAPDCFWINAWLGEARRYQGLWRPAEALLNEALRLEPGYFIAYSWRAPVRRLRGDAAGALRDVETALASEWIEERDPGSHSWALNERSLALRALHRFERSELALREAHRMNSRFVWAEPSPRPAQPSYRCSLAELDAWIRHAPRAAAPRAWRGLARAQTGDFAGALDDLSHACALRPRDGWAWAWAAGAALDANGDSPTASAALERALALDPSYGLARLLKAKLLRRRGRARAALTQVRLACAGDPLNAEAWRERVALEAELHLAGVKNSRRRLRRLRVPGPT